MSEVCIVCEGSGLRIVQENGRQVARPCECRLAHRAARMLERARIPKRYEHCSLDSYCLLYTSGHIYAAHRPAGIEVFLTPHAGSFRARFAPRVVVDELFPDLTFLVQFRARCILSLIHI